MTQPPERSTAPVIRRDQERARCAYVAVARVKPEERSDYKIAVNDLGANILRSGLAAATARLERIYKDDKIKPLLGHLAAAGIPGLTDTTAANFPEKVRGLDTDQYILATRETLQVVMWLKRAAQATFKDV